MTIETIDRSEHCPTCKQRTKYVTDRVQKCDYCGKVEDISGQKDRSVYYPVQVFPADLGSDRGVDATFCSPDHMFLWVATYSEPYGFMTLPYVEGTNTSRKQKGYLTRADLKRLASGKLKK
jgi:hypothetical protein